MVCVEFALENLQTKEKSLEFEKPVGNRMLTDPISDMLTRIRNASMVKKRSVDIPRSKMKFAIAKILEREGYVGQIEETEEAGRPVIRVHLKYNDGPAIAYLKRVSTPGRRVYVKATELPNVQSGFGISIVSTPNGLMTNNEARKRHLGGELICEIY